MLFDTNSPRNDFANLWDVVVKQAVFRNPLRGHYMTYIESEHVNDQINITMLVEIQSHPLTEHHYTCIHICTPSFSLPLSLLSPLPLYDIVITNYMTLWL